MGRKYRRGAQVDMHPDEGYGGSKMVPGYAGAYKNSKTKIIEKSATSTAKGYNSANESFVTPQKTLKRRK